MNRPYCSLSVTMSRASGAGAYSHGIAWPSPKPQLLGRGRPPGRRWSCCAAAMLDIMSPAVVPPSDRRVDRMSIQPYGCINADDPPDFDRIFGALADATRRDIVRRAIAGTEGVAELAGHYPMSFAAVQKHVAVLERAGLVSKQRDRASEGRPDQPRADSRSRARLLDRYEELWRGRIDRMADAHRPRNARRPTA